MSKRENNRPVLDFHVAPENISDEREHEMMTDWEVTLGRTSDWEATHIDSLPDTPPF